MWRTWAGVHQAKTLSTDENPTQEARNHKDVVLPSQIPQVPRGKIEPVPHLWLNAEDMAHIFGVQPWGEGGMVFLLVLEVRRDDRAPVAVGLPSSRLVH